MSKLTVIVPNWNGIGTIGACLDSLLAQTVGLHIIVVDNGSKDGSVKFIKRNYSDIELIEFPVNLGYAEGVNAGFKRGIEQGSTYIAPFNNDAIADKNWLINLATCMDKNPEVGIVACKLIEMNKLCIDSTGEEYSAWGLPYPRGRGDSNLDKYDGQADIFAASGGASLYRLSMLDKIGLFDEDFFAYYEDVDLSFRAQLAGWKVRYAPQAIAYHQIGATSGKIKGFTTYQAIKNLPWLLVRNVPVKLLITVVPRFLLAYTFFIGRAVLRGHGWAATKGFFASLIKIPKKLHERKIIQSQKTVSDGYIFEMLHHDLPPNAYNLRKARSWWWRLTGKS